MPKTECKGACEGEKAGCEATLDTALFTVFNSTYFRPIGVHDPRALYESYWTDRSGASHDFSWSEYREFLASNPAFSEALGYRHTAARIEGRDAFMEKRKPAFQGH